MSYILDSLKESQRNREQSDVPDLLTVHEVADQRPHSKRQFVLQCLLIGALLLNAGVMTWWLGSGDEDKPAGELKTELESKPDASPRLSQATPQTGTLPPAYRPSVAAPVPAVAPAPAVSSDQSGTGGQASGELHPVAEAPEVPIEKIDVAVTSVNEIKKASVAESSESFPVENSEPAEQKNSLKTNHSMASPVATATEKIAVPVDARIEQAVAVEARALPRVYNVQELPPSVRQALPRISVDGFAYASDPASRIAIIDGKFLHEGDMAGAGLRIETVTQQGAILSFRGYHLHVTRSFIE